MKLWQRVSTALGVIGVTVALHEAAHALVAVWLGGKVKEIGVGFGPTLVRAKVGSIPITVRAVPAGGYAAVDVDHLPPRRRIWMLVAGPLANIVAGLVLAPTGLRHPPAVPVAQGRRVGLSGVIGTVSALMQAAEQGPGAVVRLAGAVNVGLGVMNLLPVYPLDGGHVALNVMEARGVSVRARAAFAGITAAAFFWLVQAAVLGDLDQILGRKAPRT